MALAVDVAENRLFWTDIGLTSRGIYAARIDADGRLSGVTLILSHGNANKILHFEFQNVENDAATLLLLTVNA